MKTIFNFILYNISFEGQYFFQKPSTEIMFRIIALHNDIMIVIVGILIFVLFLIIRLLFPYQWLSIFHFYVKAFLQANYYYKNKIKTYTQSLIFFKTHRHIKRSSAWWSYRRFKRKKILFRFDHHKILEIVWTLIPTVILTIILFLSLGLIYAMDNIFDDSTERAALITLKIIGNQWYWTYQTTNGLLNKEIIFDSYLDNTITNERPLRLLQVDKEVFLPINTKIRLLITSNDVIHSWAIPSCGIKMDAIPGRINSIGLEVVTLGYKIGQCSELCGTGHAFMPIVIKIITIPEYFEICKLNIMKAIFNFILYNISFEGQYFFQKLSTEIMFRIIALHNDIINVIIVILIFILFLIIRLLFPYQNLKHIRKTQKFFYKHDYLQKKFLYNGISNISFQKRFFSTNKNTTKKKNSNKENWMESFEREEEKLKKQQQSNLSQKLENYNKRHVWYISTFGNFLGEILFFIVNLFKKDNW